MVWSCGFDAVKGDILAGTMTPDRTYGRICQYIMKNCDAPICTLLEGGYDPSKLAKCSHFVVKALLGELEEDWRVPFERPNCHGIEHSTR